MLFTVALCFFPTMLAALVSSLLQRLICHVWGQHLYWSRDLLARGAGTFLPGESECMCLLFTSICLLRSSRAPLSILRQGNSEDSSSLFVNKGLLTAAPGHVFVQATSRVLMALGLQSFLVCSYTGTHYSLPGVRLQVRLSEGLQHGCDFLEA